MPDFPGGTVTLLFTDIEGSTRLLRHLGERYAEVLAEHHRLLRAAFGAHGGHEVDTQGDSFFVSFPRAVDAVRAVVEAQRALVAHTWPEDAPVRVRMGLHTGEPRPVAWGYIGLDVNRAARVAAAGHGGQVLLSQTTRDLLGHSLPADVALKDLGPYHFKDLEHPERVYQLVIPGLPADFPPLKALDGPSGADDLSAPATPLVGRAREQGLLRDRLTAAIGGRGGLVLVGGEAGIGKTALVKDLAREAVHQGMLVLTGRAFDLSETPPYGPWAELFEQFPNLPGRPPIPALAGPGDVAASVTSQAALFAQVRDFLAAVAARQPLLLFLDDLHWADPASLDLLRFLAQRLARLPVLVGVTYRSDELTRRHPLYQLLPLLAREAEATRLDLRQLDQDDARALVRELYGLPEPDEARLATYLQARAEGNPFFAGELLRTIEEERLLRPTDRGWTLGDLSRVRVPALLNQVIAARLARLGEEARDLLSIAAVIGQEAPLEVWAKVGTVAEDALLEVVERAVEARVLEETPDGTRARFVHALLREALYEGLLPSRRRVWHRRVGEALVALPNPDPDAIAYHFQQAGDARAAEWLVKAGERAQRAYAWLTAVERFEAALALLERDEAHAGERGWLLFRIAVLRRFENPQGGVTYLEEAECLGTAATDRALVAYALFNRGLLCCMGGDFRRGLAELVAGVAALEALPGADRARLQALDSFGDPLDEHNGRGELTLWLAETGRYAEARELGERLVAGPADPATLRAIAGSRGDAYFGLGYVYAGLGQPEEARRALAKAREACRIIDHRTMIGSTLHWELFLAIVPYQADRPLERQRLMGEIARVNEQLTGVVPGLRPRTISIPILLLEGNWTEARDLLLSEHAGVNRLIGASLLGPLARNQGDRELAWAQVHECYPAGPETLPGDTACYTIGLLRLAAALALDANDLETAREWLAAHDRWLAWSGSVFGQADGLLTWAAYHRVAGDAATAYEQAAQALARATAPRQPLALLAAHRLLGELDTAAGRLADAEAHLEAALALAEACAAPHERALTLLALAELRQAEGDVPTARTLLEAARTILAPLGAVPALARADVLAARLTEGVPVPIAGGLSMREVEVLRLVAAGLTDAQVAERLFLSPRTVGQHLRSVYNKLGVDNRAAATRFAVERGLA